MDRIHYVNLEYSNGRWSNGQSIGPPIYGNLDRQKLRLWTVILDRLKIQLWTVILDCHKIMVVDHNSWWSKISVRDGNFWLSKITVWDMILDRPKLRFGTVILDCPKLRFWTVFWTVKNYSWGMSFDRKKKIYIKILNQFTIWLEECPYERMYTVNLAVQITLYGLWNLFEALYYSTIYPNSRDLGTAE